MPLKSKEQPGMVVAAIGVVFGDLGTSPLYTMKEVFGSHGLAITTDNVLGILSLIFWSLIVVISFKYASVIMRADNRGEGGIMALMSLIAQKTRTNNRYAPSLMLLGLLGTALFYGDGMITPAISVLSAVEGLHVVAPSLGEYVVPLALVVLIALFVSQRHGTAGLGSMFGPIMAIWFVTLAITGIVQIHARPEVLHALNPAYAFGFFIDNGVVGFLTLGAVVLALTGVEALYADMGHFGRETIQKAWFFFVLPALVLNYFGQGVLILNDPTTVQNPFYLIAPEWSRTGLLLLATLATIIASQAVITGAFSMTAQAMQLSYCPRLVIEYTSEDEKGQIYIPSVNFILMVAVIVLVLGFQSSSHLAAAYGIAVTCTMAIDTILALFVVCSLWRWNRALSMIVAGFFLSIDLSFLSANLLKVTQGGWFPLAIGALILLILSTWKRGRRLLAEKLTAESQSTAEFFEAISSNPPIRVPGVAVFMTANRHGVPFALQHNLEHNKILHQRIVFLTALTEEIPYVPLGDQIEFADLGNEFYRIVLRYGFKQRPSVLKVLKSRRELDFELASTTFFLSRETIIPAEQSQMASWRLQLFTWIARTTTSAMDFFRIPSDRVVEIGVQLKL